jgi:hypothetical protein
MNTEGEKFEREFNENPSFEAKTQNSVQGISFGK